MAILCKRQVMGEGEIFKVSCNPRRSVLHKHRRQQGITIGCIWATGKPLLFGHLVPGAGIVPLSAASFLMEMLTGDPGGNISVAPSPFG